MILINLEHALNEVSAHIFRTFLLQLLHDLKIGLNFFTIMFKNFLQKSLTFRFWSYEWKNLIYNIWLYIFFRILKFRASLRCIIFQLFALLFNVLFIFAMTIVWLLLSRLMRFCFYLDNLVMEQNWWAFLKCFKWWVIVVKSRLI